MNTNQTIEQAIAAQEARRNNGNWVAACGGTETPFTINRVRVLYCYQPASGKHAYMNLDTDMVMTDEEFDMLRGR
tara:strand:- start:3625 stop:3849 length:225 start_codon:yes stop_codon:yes gene_type:complete